MCEASKFSLALELDVLREGGGFSVAGFGLQEALSKPLDWVGNLLGRSHPTFAGVQ